MEKTKSRKTFEHHKSSDNACHLPSYNSHALLLTLPVYRALSSSFGMESFIFNTKREFNREDWNWEKRTSTQRAPRMGTLENKAIARCNGFLPSLLASCFFSFSLGAGSNPCYEEYDRYQVLESYAVRPFSNDPRQ